MENIKNKGNRVIFVDPKVCNNRETLEKYIEKKHTDCPNFTILVVKEMSTDSSEVVLYVPPPDKTASDLNSGGFIFDHGYCL